MMRRFTLLLLLLLSILMLTACVSARDKMAAPNTITINGTISYKTFEGGFWAVDGDDGGRYTPMNLSEEFLEDKLSVQVSAIVRTDMASFHKYGKMIEIVSIDKR